MLLHFRELLTLSDEMLILNSEALWQVVFDTCEWCHITYERQVPAFFFFKRSFKNIIDFFDAASFAKNRLVSVTLAQARGM